MKGVLMAGVRLDGAGVQVLGGEVTPAVQLSVTELEYPLIAVADPSNVAVCPTVMLCGELERESS